MKDNLYDSVKNIESYYHRLIKYRSILQSIIDANKEAIILNEEQKAAIEEGDKLIVEVKNKIKELEDYVGGFEKGPASA